MSNILKHCKALPTREYEKGATVLKEGSKDDEILFLKKGSVEVRVGDSVITTISTKGAVLGEVAVLLDRGHSASVIALKDCELHVLEKAEKSLSKHPQINREISRTLARRLSRASDSVAELNKRVEFQTDLEDFEMMMLWEEDGM